ncbi:DNA cytosine methyltransferase [Patescibacteria group bacterium]|nr:DNA cytosine methyltransferase [Patescibacteria group bacterium]MBU1683346.1 DNA cytosine methyltransferase [Patescibacteria group bacterium]MBU1934938.1 DNA cytosine methyltransferase [Patescibacteria group bacterium]
MYKFIDLFAGIGGFHLAFHNLGAECIFACEWDKHARKTYKHYFQKISPDLFKKKKFYGDINSIKDIENEIDDFDILTAGFPCQPFSQAGFKKGFEDTRGTLFFKIAEIIDIKKPKAIFLENVRGLLNHNNGKTFEVIKRVIEKDLGYSFYWKIVKASDFGLPQLRPRLFMVGFRDKNIDFEFPKPIKLKTTMSDIWGGDCSRKVGFTLRCGGRGSRIDDRRNWDAYLVNGKVRRLSPEEGKIMQGFPEDFVFPVSYVEAMKQLGNSVAINAIQAVGKEIIKSLNRSEIKIPEKSLKTNIKEFAPTPQAIAA